MSEINLPPLRDVIATHGLDARKALGQHFLLDLNITRKIARLAGVDAGEKVIEIGPGPGGLTRALLETGADVIAIEKDARCLGVLSELSEAYPGKLEIVQDDALKVRERDLAKDGVKDGVKIISNLPYNISTELLIKWLRLNQAQHDPYWSCMALMFQKEVADRILAEPGSKTYGRLSVIAQAASRPRPGFDLPARAFTPPPKVDSSVVIFDPAKLNIALHQLESVTQAAFSQRRKMLRSSLKSVFGPKTESILEQKNIAPTARAEEISVNGFIEIAQAVSGE